MIGLVVVSHSLKLAETALELALAMVPNGAPRVVLAAGAGTDADGIPIIGTDAMKVATAIDELADTDGVLVLMDLGSAVLSAELALELRMSDVEVTLSAAPFVEGLLAAVVRAAGVALAGDPYLARPEGPRSPRSPPRRAARSPRRADSWGRPRLPPRRRRRHPARPSPTASPDG